MLKTLELWVEQHKGFDKPKGNDAIAAVAKVMKDEDALSDDDIKDMDVSEDGMNVEENKDE